MLEKSKNLRIIFFLLLIISILTIPLFSFLGADRSIRLDQAFSVYVASHNLQGIIANLKNDSGPPLYYFLLATWIRIFGISEFAIRSLSGILYILTLVFVYVLGNTLYNKRRTGLLCSFLYMLSPLAIRHAQNARMYSLLGLLGTLSMFFFLRLFLIKTDSKKDLVLYTFVNILGTFTHYWFFFIILSQVVSHILFFNRKLIKKFFTAIFISVLPFLILWLPILLIQIDIGSTSWIDKSAVFQALTQTFLDFYGKKFALLVYAVFLILIVIKIEGFKLKFQNISDLKEFIKQKQILVFLIALSVSLLFPLIISQVKPIYLVGRYTIIALLPFVMIIAPFLSRFGNKFLLLACCYILFTGVFLGFIKAKTAPQQYSDRLTSEYLIEHANNDDVLIFTSLSRAAIDYYLHLLNPDKIFVEISFPSEMASHPGWQDIERMINQKNMLENEADNIVRYIEKVVKNNTQIWVFYSFDTEIDKILKSRLDTHFSFKEKKELRGSFYTEILVYQKKPAKPDSL